MAKGSTLHIPVPEGFDLGRVVCSYGYFMLAPNHWAPATQSLHRPLHDDAGRIIQTHIQQTKTRPDRLRIQCDASLDAATRQVIKKQIRRMLRLDEDLSDWFKASPQAKREGFGRLFRSPTLFEDLIKTITGCNVAWPNTMTMNRLLCEQIGGGEFPTPTQLARTAASTLKAKTKVGYRAKRIVHLAQQVKTGELNLAWFEEPKRESDEAFTALGRLHGFGPYAAANACQHLGFYDQLPIDSETYRHFCKHFNISRPDDPTQLHRRIAAHYDQYAPFQFLAYWYELWRDYEQKLGDARSWQADDGARVTR
jgi:3-methyladenine DNA glycosylase/8-oxoguanine DNA glycosylase